MDSTVSSQRYSEESLLDLNGPLMDALARRTVNSSLNKLRVVNAAGAPGSQRTQRAQSCRLLSERCRSKYRSYYSNVFR